jgi:hypothetical protein
MRTYRSIVALLLAMATFSACGSGSEHGTSADGGAGNPPGCPASAPSSSQACAGQLSCNYNCGGTTANCVQGRWSVATSESGCSTNNNGSCPSAVAPIAPFSKEALGDPCVGQGDCATGLTCENAYLRGGHIAAEQLCTVRCGDTGVCPDGSVCEEAEGASERTDAGLRKLRLCFPVCTGDADCQKGKRAGQCVSRDGGARICEPLTCSGATCPGGYQCVGGSCPGPDSEAPSIPGFCQKR